MGIYSTKSFWHRLLHPVVVFCVRRRLSPDLFTWGALTFSAVAVGALALSARHPRGLWLVPPCVLLRLLFNLMDGQVARGLGVADRLGEVKNELGDRLADALIFVALALHPATNTGLGAVALALVLCASFVGVLSKATGGPRLYLGVMGKGDRMVALALLALWAGWQGDVAWLNVYLWVVTVGSAITLWQRVRAIWQLEG